MQTHIQIGYLLDQERDGGEIKSPQRLFIIIKTISTFRRPVGSFLRDPKG
jgi:hypothetical protein